MWQLKSLDKFDCASAIEASFIVLRLAQIFINFAAIFKKYSN